MPFTRHHTGLIFREFIARIIERKGARRYVEIGVRDGSTLALIACPSIGVDPVFQFSMNPMGPKTSLHLYQMTSDAFFRDHDPRAILGGPIDVIFLDGLHQFEFLLRDFINSEAVSHRDGLIMLDDCLPINAEMTERYHRPELRIDKDLAPWWTGDVWKLLPILKELRPDLRVTPVDTSPTGNICVTRLDPTSTVLRDNFYKIVDRYKQMVLDDKGLEALFRSFPPVAVETVLNGFDASMTVGP